MSKDKWHWAHTLIDTGVIRDFMSSMFTKKAKLPLQAKSDVYKVTAVDNKLLFYNKEMINYEIKEIRL